MYKAGHILRRSSIRLKSISGRHSQLQMVIAQIREVRTTFKAFMAAQFTLSEDLVKWSSKIENEAIHSSILSLADLNSLWYETQKGFADNLKQFRCNFNRILEAERHVDHAKQRLSLCEESEKDMKKELDKAYNKAQVKDIQSVRERLSKSEKAKKIARLDVMNKIRENEAIRMMQIKDGLSLLGDSFVQMAHKGGIIFRAAKCLATEIPDVHDRSIHQTKFQGDANSRHVQEARDQLHFHESTIKGRHCHMRNSDAFQDPPPPYIPPQEKLNDPSLRYRGSSPHGASAPQHSCESLSHEMEYVYPCLTAGSPQPIVPGASSNPAISWRSPQGISLDSDSEMRTCNGSATQLGQSQIHSHLSSQKWPQDLEMKKTTAHHQETMSAEDSSFSSSLTPSSTPPSLESSSESARSNVFHANLPTPLPYNPYYEWSEFPSKK